MKKEKVVLSFIGIAIGLICAGVVFYLYQTTKALNIGDNIIKATPTPTQAVKSNLLLTIAEPGDEKVVENKVITLSGQTNPDSTVIVITESNQEVLKPTKMGAFSTTLTLTDGQNLIKVVSYSTNGESTSKDITVTYSKEDF
jgi:hypothetical protein